MRNNKQNVNTWRIKTKDKLIELKGGKCCRCGYKKCKKALAFHHVDPSTKKETLSNLLANGTKWEKLVEEVEKCIMVCANCHAEIHEELHNKNID